MPIETVVVETPVVGCDGGVGPLGHPLVYISLEKKHAADCPYCGKHYKLKEGAHAGGHH